MVNVATCFLTAMAASDLMLLLVQVPYFFSFNDVFAAHDSFKRFIQGYIIVLYLMSNIFITCTCCLTVAVAIERFISLHLILRVCTIFRARCTIVFIFSISFMFHVSKFFEYEPNPDLNSTILLIPTSLLQTPAYDTYLHIANITLTFLIPVLLLIIVNSFLIYSLATHRRRMLRHKTTSSATSSLDMPRITAIVVATVILFIACHSVGVFLALTIAPSGRIRVFQQPLYSVLRYINNTLVLANSCFNFILYCTFHSKFRKILRGIFKSAFCCKTA